MNHKQNKIKFPSICPKIVESQDFAITTSHISVP